MSKRNTIVGGESNPHADQAQRAEDALRATLDILNAETEAYLLYYLRLTGCRNTSRAVRDLELVRLLGSWVAARDGDGQAGVVPQRRLTDEEERVLRTLSGMGRAIANGEKVVAIFGESGDGDPEPRVAVAGYRLLEWRNAQKLGAPTPRLARCLSCAGFWIAEHASALYCPRCDALDLRPGSRKLHRLGDEYYVNWNNLRVFLNGANGLADLRSCDVVRASRGSFFTYDDPPVQLQETRREARKSR